MLVGFEPQCFAIFLNIVMVSIICLLVLTDCGDKPDILKNHSIINTPRSLKLTVKYSLGPTELVNQTVVKLGQVSER